MNKTETLKVINSVLLIVSKLSKILKMKLRCIPSIFISIILFYSCTKNENETNNVDLESIDIEIICQHIWNPIDSNNYNENFEVYNYAKGFKLISVDYYYGNFYDGTSRFKRTTKYQYEDGYIVEGNSRYYLNTDSLIYYMEFNSENIELIYNNKNQLISTKSNENGVLKSESTSYWENNNLVKDSSCHYDLENNYYISRYYFDLQKTNSMIVGLKNLGQRSNNLKIRRVDSYYDFNFQLEQRRYNRYEYEVYEDSVIRINYNWDDFEHDSLLWDSKDIYVKRKVKNFR